MLGGGNCLFTKLPTNFRAAHLFGGFLGMGMGPGTATTDSWLPQAFPRRLFGQEGAG